VTFVLKLLTTSSRNIFKPKLYDFNKTYFCLFVKIQHVLRQLHVKSMKNCIRFGCFLPVPVTPTQKLIRIAKVNENAGFNSVWVPDHILFINGEVVPEAWTKPKTNCRTILQENNSTIQAINLIFTEDKYDIQRMRTFEFSFGTSYKIPSSDNINTLPHFRHL